MSSRLKMLTNFALSMDFIPLRTAECNSMAGSYTSTDPMEKTIGNEKE